MSKRTMDLQVFCTSKHEPQVMLLCSRVDPSNRKDLFLQCGVCGNCVKLVINPRLETTVYFSEEGLS
jgi:hypothetical protein